MYEQSIALRTVCALFRFIRSICLYYWIHRDLCEHPQVQEGCDCTSK